MTATGIACASIMAPQATGAKVGTSGRSVSIRPFGADSTSKRFLPHSPSFAPFRRGRKALHRSRWAVKGDLIRGLLALGEDASTEHMLKCLRGCGRPLKGKGENHGEPNALGVKAMRSAGADGQDQSGWTGGIARCNKRLCPICGLRIAVRRILVLRKRAEWVAEHYPTALHVAGAITCCHHKGGSPRQKYDALSALFDEWKKQDWVGGRKKKGVVIIEKTLLGYFMCPEDTFGPNGHHPHLQFAASLAVPEGLDASGRTAHFEAFRTRSQEWFRDNAPRFGITCKWLNRWMTMAKSPIEAVVRYTLKAEKEEAIGDLISQGMTRREALQKLRLEKVAAMEAIAGDLDGLAREATLGQLKLDRTGASFFEMPAVEQLRLWNETIGMKWFRVGGIWRDAETNKSDETLAEEDETKGEPVAEITPTAWSSLGSEIWHILSALNEDVRYSRDQVATVWGAAQEMAFAWIDRRTIRDTLVSMIPSHPTREVESPPVASRVRGEPETFR